MKVYLSIILSISVFCSFSYSEDDLATYLNNLDEHYSSIDNITVRYYQETFEEVGPPLNKTIYNIIDCTATISNEKARLDETIYSSDSNGSFENLRQLRDTRQQAIRQTKIIANSRTYTKPITQNNRGNVTAQSKGNSIFEDKVRYPMSVIHLLADGLINNENWSKPEVISDSEGVREYFISWSPAKRAGNWPESINSFYRIKVSSNFDSPMIYCFESGFYYDGMDSKDVRIKLTITPDANSILGYSTYTLERYRSGGRLHHSTLVSINRAKSGMRVLPETFRLLLKKGNSFVELGDGTNYNEIVVDDDYVVIDAE